MLTPEIFAGRVPTQEAYRDQQWWAEKVERVKEVKKEKGETKRQEKGEKNPVTFFTRDSSLSHEVAEFE